MAGKKKIVCMGGGLAGLVAANRAIELGMSATVLERLEEPLHHCASRLNGGVFHVAFKSVAEPADILAAAVETATEGFVRPDFARTLANGAMPAIRWLESAGAEFGRLEPTEGWKDHVLEPLGFHRHTRLTWKGYGADRLMQRLEAKLVQSGGAFLRGRAVRELLFAEGRCLGVAVDGPNGVERVSADAVVISDGGFQGNEEMLRRHVTAHPERMTLRGPASGMGDGIRMAEAAGAELAGMEYFYGHLMSADSLGGDKLWPFPVLDILAAAGVVVDRDGQRFVDEGKGGVKGGVYMANALARHKDSLAAVVVDAAIWNTTGREFFCPPNPNLIEGGGTVHAAEDVETLGSMLGLPAGALAKSIADYNRAVADDGLSHLSPARTAGQRLRPISRPPYFGIPICAGITYTMGGVVIDRGGRVLGRDGDAIPGLYAAGSSCGGFEGGPSGGYVGGLVKATVLGLVAAQSASSDDDIS